MPLGQNSAQRPTHSDARPSPWPRHSGARGPLAEPAHGLHVTAWWRWGKVGRSSIHGGGVTHQASGWRWQLTRASCRWEGWKNQTTATFSDEVGAPVTGDVLRRGGKEEEAQA
jgi:hypothetical protein